MKLAETAGIVALVVALAVAGHVLLSRPSVDVDDLAERVARLEKQLAQLKPTTRMATAMSAQNGANAPSVKRAVIVDSASPSLDDDADQPNIDQLRAELSDIRTTLAGRGLLPPDQQTVADATDSIMSTDATSMEKLSALRVLRSADARTDEVVLAMIDVYDNEPSADLRADIFRQLDGVTTPELRDPLLEAVSQEQDANVREEAAETLQHFLPDDAVQAWLEYLLEDDPSEDVRRQAARSLGVPRNEN